ncbi:MAG TPA: hypothetical protein VEC37_14900 [Bacillota bacterium]|nr:hypothetical protein [Bacillota bacterium]
MKKGFIVVLLIACSLGAVARADTYRIPGKIVLQERVRRDDVRQREEERRRQDEERRRRDEEQRKHDEERRRHDEEQRKRDEERRRSDEEQRRRDEENRRRDEENRRRDEENRRRDEEQRRRDEERHRHEDERRRPDPRRHEDYNDRDDRHPEFSERLRAKQVLRETAECLERAQRVARYGHFREGLGKAYAHQEEARNLYYEGRYQRAIVHSMRAREIANDIISINREGRSDRRHGRYWHNDSLDDELSIRIVDDNIAIKLKINLD